jgi:hypothetical protein
MANTVWDIANLERHLPDGDTCPDGAVYTVHWTASLEEDGETASCYGSVGLGEPNPDNFTPFSELTKEEVVAWVQEALGGEEKVNEIEAALQAQIDEQRSPSKAAGVPW